VYLKTRAIGTRCPCGLFIDKPDSFPNTHARKVVHCKSRCG
jgi:hypothetical protein